ncbi:entericidin A/B family lipoprotein [Frigidibacter sp. MR17.14]
MRIALVLTALLALTACETVKGAGHDIQKGGAAISQEAAKTQQQM